MQVVRSTVPPEIKGSLDACWKEGVTAQAVMTIFDYYLIPYALYLGATPERIGLLVAVPNLLSALAQLFAVRAVDTAGSRRGLLVKGVFFQALALSPLSVLPFLRLPGKTEVLILLVSVFRVTGAVMGPAWGSLVSDYLPEGQRGQYMGWRSRVVGVAGIAGLAFWGTVLTVTRKASPEAGFVILFAAAAFFRFLSFYYMRRMADVGVAHPSSGGEFTLWMFVRRFRENNLVKFVYYVAGVTFATQLASPYFSVYMLKDLGFDYAAYTSVHLASVLSGLVAFPIWGRHSDHVGTARIMKSVSALVPVVPFLWLFARDPVSLCLVEAFSGFVWSGFTLASANFVYDAVPAPLRVRCLAYYNLINGAAVFLGAWLGGVLAGRLPPLFGHRYLSLFFISGVLRLAAHYILAGRFEETRPVRPVSAPRLYLSVLGLRPLAGENTEPALFPPLRPPRERSGGVI